MRIRIGRIVTVAAAGLVSACGGKQPPETPAPQPAPAQAAAPAPAPPPPPAPVSRPDDGAAAEMSRKLMADLTAAIHFDFDRSDVRAADTELLDRKAAILGRNTDVEVTIAGNADERGSDEYNLALGMRRAVSAKRYLTAKGVDAGRLQTVSYGEERPVASGQTEAAFAANRRDDFNVTRGGERMLPPN